MNKKGPYTFLKWWTNPSPNLSLLKTCNFRRWLQWKENHLANKGETLDSFREKGNVFHHPVLSLKCCLESIATAPSVTALGSFLSTRPTPPPPHPTLPPPHAAIQARMTVQLLYLGSKTLEEGVEKKGRETGKTGSMRYNGAALDTASPWAARHRRLFRCVSAAPGASAGGFPGGSAPQGEDNEFSGNLVQVHSQGSKTLPSRVLSVPSGGTQEIRSHAYRCGIGCIQILEWRAVGNEAVRLRAQLRAQAVPELGKGNKAGGGGGWGDGSISRNKVVMKAILGGLQCLHLIQ